MLPDFERADRVGEFWGYPESRAFADRRRPRCSRRRTTTPSSHLRHMDRWTPC